MRSYTSCVLDEFDLCQKTGTLGDGYDGKTSKNGAAFSFTDKETFEGVTPISASKVKIITVVSQCVCMLFAIFP